MSYSEQDLVNLGARFSTQRLIEQAGVSLALGRAHAEELGARYSKAKLDELEGAITTVRGLAEQQTEGKIAKASGNMPVATLLSDCKHWIADLLTAADNAFEEEPDFADKYHQGGKIGRSVPKVLGRMEGLLVLAQKHQAELSAWGFGDAELNRGKALLTELASSNTAQETAVRALPPKTRELYAAKGRTYLLLKQLSRTARAVFRSDPTIAAKLNLDVLNRVGRRHNGGLPT